MLGTAILAKNMVIGDLSENGLIGYEETQKSVLFPETTIEFEPDEGFAMFSIEPAAFDIVANEKVFVVFDGVAYNCTASAVIQVSESMKLVAVGNQSIGGYGDDTGEPFLIDCMNEGDAKWNNFYVRDSDTHTVSIATENEIIHPIDPKYLPGVCLPLVELSTEPTAEGATLTAEESALMDALSGAPCIIKFPYDGMTTYCCPSAMSADGVVAYYLNCADAILVLGYEGGTWVFARP